MGKFIYDEGNGLWYEQQGDYYIPCLRVSEEEHHSIGVWGRRHLEFLKKRQKVVYREMLASGKLNSYLSDINKQAEEMFARLINRMAKCEGITEQLKADNQMEWIACMNSIHNRASEVVLEELIFV